MYYKKKVLYMSSLLSHVVIIVTMKTIGIGKSFY